MWYKLGYLTGLLLKLAFIGYIFVDGWKNVHNGNSVIVDLGALLLYVTYIDFNKQLEAIRGINFYSAQYLEYIAKFVNNLVEEVPSTEEDEIQKLIETYRAEQEKRNK
jgi:hypothetical protein